MKQSPRIGIGIGMGDIGIGDSYRFFKVIYVKNQKESVRIGNIQINRYRYWYGSISKNRYRFEKSSNLYRLIGISILVSVEL